ncbi:Plant transcription factor [Macleaya cordata]|uniref:Plant transcription factor n=1 Tax=Macleaya cordata TaxID=56857 RepID=A0A200Q5N5_MACCD|nr:Plant transcription factor [Macleaya cordata]
MMKKFSHFLTSRSALSELLLSRKASNIEDALWSRSFISQAGISSARPDFASNGNNLGKVFVDYTLFKGKAALSMSPVLPKFSKINAGNMRVEKKGSVLLTFFPAIGERKYDWQKKQVFALSATELGSLISLGPADSAEFFHDPSMKTSNAGQVRKSLSVKPLSDDGGYYFSLNVVNAMLKTNERFYVPVSKAEFAVMRTSFSFILPHIMGWDRLFNHQVPASTSVSPMRQPEMQLNPDLEWDSNQSAQPIWICDSETDPGI